MKVLVVDDSPIFRKVVRDSLAALPGVEIVGVAGDGAVALEKIASLRPDLVTLDVEMPVLGGIDVLRRLPSVGHRPNVIMLSAMTAHGAVATTQALTLGAFDFVLKPSGADLEENTATLREELLPKVEAARKGVNSARAGTAAPANSAPPASPVQGLPRHGAGVAAVNAIGIGISTGGPAALMRLLPKLPADLPVPLFIVQHMPPMFTKSLADDLDRQSRIRVHEAMAGQSVEPGCAYIAPGGKQMKVGKIGPRYTLNVTEDPPERNCRPSVDYLFRSLAHTYGGQAMALIMTGMGDDGVMGCRLMKRNGSPVVAQDEASCVVYGMPKQVVQAGLADVVCPLDQLAELITESAGRSTLLCR